MEILVTICVGIPLTAVIIGAAVIFGLMVADNAINGGKRGTK